MIQPQRSRMATRAAGGPPAEARAGEYPAIRDEVAEVGRPLPAAVVLKVNLEVRLLDAKESVDTALSAGRGGFHHDFKQLHGSPSAPHCGRQHRAAAVSAQAGDRSQGQWRNPHHAGRSGDDRRRRQSDRGQLRTSDPGGAPAPGRRPGSAGTVGTRDPLTSPADATGSRQGSGQLPLFGSRIAAHSTHLIAHGSASRRPSGMAAPQRSQRP